MTNTFSKSLAKMHKVRNSELFNLGQDENCSLENCSRKHSIGKRQAALEDAEQQCLFSTSEGSVESSSKAEHPGFDLGIFNTP